MKVSRYLNSRFDVNAIDAIDIANRKVRERRVAAEEAKVEALINIAGQLARIADRLDDVARPPEDGAAYGRVLVEIKP